MRRNERSRESAQHAIHSSREPEKHKLSDEEALREGIELGSYWSNEKSTVQITGASKGVAETVLYINPHPKLDSLYTDETSRAAKKGKRIYGLGRACFPTIYYGFKK